MRLGRMRRSRSDLRKIFSTLLLGRRRADGRRLLLFHHLPARGRGPFPPPQHVGRGRPTMEFQEICMMLSAAKGAHTRPSQVRDAHGLRKGRRGRVADRFSQRGVSHIEREIYTTSQKLQELSRLVRDSSRSLFNDPSEKISSYVHSISEDIRRLTGSWSRRSNTCRRRSGKNCRWRTTASWSSGSSRAASSTPPILQGRRAARTENVKAQQERKRKAGNPSASKAAKLLRGRPSLRQIARGRLGRCGGAGGGGLPRPDGTLAVRETWSENGGRGSGGDGDW